MLNTLAIILASYLSSYYVLHTLRVCADNDIYPSRTNTPQLLTIDLKSNNTDKD